jgi:ATP-dependent helicase/nuclease subunit A
MSRRRRPPDDAQLGLGLDGPVSGPAMAPHGPPPPSGPLALPEALRLERNLAILAGAGAGKTYSLVTMCLHLLSGARAGHDAVEAGGLGLLTFTDKAAGEMRGRLRARLDELAHERGDEQELRASFEGLGRPFPSAATWRTIRDELGAASIGTFHALCTQLLRRAPASSGVNPNLELLDERTARALLVQSAERVVLEQVQAGNASVRRLVRDLGFGGDGEWGLVDALVPVVARVREEGLAPERLPVADPRALRRQFDESLSALRREVALGAADIGQQRPVLEAFEALLTQATFDGWPELAPQLAELLKNRRVPALAALRPWLQQDVSKLDRAARSRHLGLLHGACAMAPHEAVVRQVLADVTTRYELELERRGAVDFTGLLVQARDLLRDVPEARREAQGRFQALLVDEFQDTNRLQLELVLLLAERRDGAARAVPHAGGAPGLEQVIPLEPAFLAVVGDRKQAIYEFRGADVSVFEIMAQALERSGGGRAYLQASRRSSPQLVGVLNALMPRVLGPAKYAAPIEDFEIAYAPETDDLRAVRAPSLDETPLCALGAFAAAGDEGGADAFREADAEAVARAVAELVHRRAYVVHPRSKDGHDRPVRGGDVALLFQRFTQVEVYRQALVRHGVRHRVVRGRGFYGAQEVVDVASFLAVLADPSDALSLAAVLRSPIVGLTDTSLVRLSVQEHGRLGLAPEAVLALEVAPAWMPSAEAERLLRFTDTWRALRPERDRLGLRALLRVAFEAFAWRVLVAAAPYGEQALANLDKLMDLATAREARGVGVAALARELLSLADEAPTEAQGEVIDEHDADAVTLCTVHQAKGLEWPVVVLPDLAATLPNRDKALRFDRALGLALRPPREDDGAPDSLSAKEIDERTRRRARAESLRLLYVALTRARDRVVLGLCPAKPRKGTWAAELGLDQLDSPAPHPLDTTSPPAPPPEEPLLPAPEARAHVEAALARVRRAPLPTPATAVLAVTQLQDFATCPRLFHFAHQLSLPPVSGAARGEAEGEGAEASVDVRARGTAAHRLLELTPLPLVGTPALRAHLGALQRSEGLDGAGDVVPRWVEAFWATPFGRRLGALGDARVHRELPFLLSLAGGDGFRLALKGQIDLLVEEDGPVLVVDYKTSVPSAAGLAPYRFQLGCYALAARHFIGREVPVRAGIVFLRHDDLAPQFLDALPDAAELERALVAEARTLARSQVTGAWAGRERATCEALGCGFLSRCHPA